MSEIKKLFEIVGHRKQAVIILMLSIMVGIVEFVGLALLIPYISIAMQKEIPKNTYLETLLSSINIDGFNQFIIFITAIICVFYIFRLALNLYFSYSFLRFVNKIRHIILSKLFSHYAHIDYAHFACRNTSNFKKTLLSESLNIQGILQSIITIVSELFILLLLLGMILYTDWKLSIGLIVVFGIMFFSVTSLLNNKLSIIANQRKEFAKGVHRHADETLNNFKYIKLIGSEKVKTDLFEKNSYGLTQVNTIFGLLNQSPRFILETIGLLLIISIIFYLAQTKSSSTYLMETLAIYAVAFYRTLPSLNKIITSASNFQYFKNTIDQLYDDLQLPSESHSLGNEIEFSNKIELKDITFSHKNSNSILFNNFNLVIHKGEKIALIGSSGSGKSTLVDILMGILKPQKGSVVVDNQVINDNNIRAWRKMFGYIPQDIYLYDATVADNVTFGREYDEKKVIEVLKQANIYEYLQTKDGIETFVGEGGVQLSGGQKQRIGIARALYQDPEILVLDEATSALDSETEEKIMEEIYTISKHRTLIVIAHRLSTLNKCERKIQL